jgi:asparagine synthase (glutamine-hydrolysing)
MCGIAGIVGAGVGEGRNDRTVLTRMVATQRHRGPDGEGTWFGPGIALGHTRLKIIDLSDNGAQPMSTEDGRLTIVYNGEIFNYRELRTELAGCRFRSTTDTEVALEAFRQWGPVCLEKFVGMFAFAIWDASTRRLFCARDRLGIKPFYYASQNGCFYFASEVRALLAAGIPATPNERVIYDFLARDFYDHSEDTFFLGIRRLPAGCWLEVVDGVVSPPRSYWSLATEAALHVVPAKDQDREYELIARAQAAVELALRSDVPVAVALSGGLDSSTLLALLDRAHPDPAAIEAFSFTFSDPAYSERPWVEAMARHTGRRAHFVDIEAADFARHAVRLVEQQEEPFAGAPIVAYARCFELIRRHGFIVVMDGSGVDESLAGYARFRPALWADLLNANDVAGLERELKAVGITTATQRAAALEQAAMAARPEADIGVGQDLSVSVRPECLHPDFVKRAGCPSPHFERPFCDNLRNLMYRELRYTKLPRALRFRDRLSMAVGTELRPPFLDHRLLAWEFALPSRDFIYEGVGKAILRRAVARQLPDALRLATKRSVQTPQREWFRGELACWLREIIDSPSFWSRGWVDREKGCRAMQAYFEGRGDNSFFLWQWANLELWARRFIDKSAP